MNALRNTAFTKEPKKTYDEIFYINKILGLLVFSLT